jgi:hypothetical protein
MLILVLMVLKSFPRAFDNYEVNHIIVSDVLSGNIITIIEDDQEVRFLWGEEGSFCNINVALPSVRESSHLLLMKITHLQFGMLQA